MGPGNLMHTFQQASRQRGINVRPDVQWHVGVCLASLRVERSITHHLGPYSASSSSIQGSNDRVGRGEGLRRVDGLVDGIQIQSLPQSNRKRECCNVTLLFTYAARASSAIIHGNQQFINIDRKPLVLMCTIEWKNIVESNWLICESPVI